LRYNINKPKQTKQMAKEKLTEADKKFITKFFGEVDSNATNITRSNRFGGSPVSVDPVFAKCYDFIMKVEQALNSQSEAQLKAISPELKMTNAVQNFDRARMIALKMDSNAYMELLD
jgi:hypothetical protein